MKKYREAFNAALEKYNVTAKSLTFNSGANEMQISMFRSGKRSLKVDTFFNLIDALPPEAQEYFFSYLLGEDIAKKANIPAVVQGCSSEMLSDILDSVATRLRTRENTESMGVTSVVS